jgi:hypothetical protein
MLYIALSAGPRGAAFADRELRQSDEAVAFSVSTNIAPVNL